MRDGQRLPKDWLRPGEKWPGQKQGLPEPGTKASVEFERQVYREQFGKDRPAHLEPRKPPKS